MDINPYEAEHEDFRELCGKFLEREAVPHHARWERDGIIEPGLWAKAGEAGLLGLDAPVEHGGGGQADFRYTMVFIEELIRAGITAPGFVAHNDLISSYLATRTTAEQRARWLPGLCAGKLIAAIALSEPEAGSDLAGIRTRAVRDGDHYVLNGQKTFITNGENADLVIVAAKTGTPRGGQAMTLLVVERGMPGFSRGRRLAKVGWPASDTSELFFDDCRVPVTNLLGRENAGMGYLMGGLPRERLCISAVAVATAEKVLAETLGYARERKAFGQPIGSFQHNKFLLATLDTEVTMARVFLNHCVAEFNARRLTVTDAAKLKWWTTELQVRLTDRCLQLHGGYGYLSESPIAREWANSRVQTIYGGTTEVMKELLGSSLGL
ncbi:acyl-CoA dehydrogenase family protein [Amycolatopsis albispora]|uniref:Acyl-CoA dehydrogenase n=1 Tax=Amycolatopsis albispora TaxID=1804986 RepID=A0A344L008_9PSEU|nr:acyl-CoA dehydrogenase family protein [Amycolatopsis albispora]AXB41382.1 acyl-CoA dehydrogenase [Amycolatopsis albispora]